MNGKVKRILLGVFGLFVMVLAGCGNSDADEVIIYSNADDEAIAIIEETLDEKGFEGQYTVQVMGTSELGGKIIAEGDSIEADIVTMSAYFLESAQQQNDMFESLKASKESMDDYGDFQIPILGNMGAIFMNTQALEATNLPIPETLKELADPKYEGYISFPNLFDSSTGWLLVQAVLAEYGEEEGEHILEALKSNAGPHLESSGSGPIKKVKAGEVPIGFGLRNQAVYEQQAGSPIEVIDPKEGNFTLTESISVVKKEENERAIEIAQALEDAAREPLLQEYPVILYDGEEVDKDHDVPFEKWEEKLTVELLEAHQDIFQSAEKGAF